MFLQSQDHNLIQFTFLNTTVLGTGGGRANMTMENEKMNETGSLTLKGVVGQSLSVSYSLQPHGLQHARPPCSSLSPGVCSNSCPLSQWCYPTISFSVIPFSFCPQSFPASRSFPISQLFASGGQNIGASASASVLPLNIQDWFPVGLTGLISLKFKGLSRVFYSTTVRKHQLETILFISTTYILQSHSKNWIRRILNHFSKGNRGSSYCEPLVTFLSINQYKNCFCIDIVLFYVCFCLKTPLNIIRRFSRVRLFATLGTVSWQAPLSMGFPRQEYWSELPFPSPGGSSWPRDQTWVSCSSCIISGFFFFFFFLPLRHWGSLKDTLFNRYCWVINTELMVNNTINLHPNDACLTHIFPPQGTSQHSCS